MNLTFHLGTTKFHVHLGTSKPHTSPGHIQTSHLTCERLNFTKISTVHIQTSNLTCPRLKLTSHLGTSNPHISPGHIQTSLLTCPRINLTALLGMYTAHITWAQLNLTSHLRISNELPSFTSNLRTPKLCLSWAPHVSVCHTQAVTNGIIMPLWDQAVWIQALSALWPGAHSKSLSCILFN
jgi:hypothetical protein